MPGIGTRVLLGLPVTSGARKSWNWINAFSGINMPLGSSMGRTLREDLPIARARNEICQEAIDIGAQYLFFLSDDVLPPGDVIIKMLDKIGREFPVENGQVARASMITGVYWTKQQPIEPYLWQRPGLLGSYRDWKVGEFFPLDLAGCDCLLIDVAALKEVPFPWFSTDWLWNDEDRPSSIATEDFYFYTKMRKYGHRLFCDTSVQCFHEDRSTGELFALSTDMYQAGGIPPFEKNEFLVAELGSGSSSPYLGPNCKIVRFDIRADVRPDVRCDLLNIPEFHFGKYDRVRAQHVLEHFTRHEAPACVSHWARLLKPGGKMIINLPNILWAAQRLLADGDEPGVAGVVSPSERDYAYNQLLGDQAYGPASWHKNVFTRRKLLGLLHTVPGLKDITVEVTEESGINLTATATLDAEFSYESIGAWWREIEEREGKPFPQAWEEMVVKVEEGPAPESTESAPDAQSESLPIEIEPVQQLVRTCETCNGRGLLGGSKRQGDTCLVCNGQGVVVVPDQPEPKRSHKKKVAA